MGCASIGSEPVRGFLILLSAVAYAAYLVVAGGLVRQIGGIRMNAYGMSAASLAMAGYALLRSLREQPGIVLSYPPAMYGFMIIAAVTTVIPFIHAGRHEADRKRNEGPSFP